MGEKVKRPLTVWMTPVLLLLLTLIFLLITWFFIRIELGWAGDMGLTPVFWMTCLVIASICFLSFWALAKRKPYGRWLSALVLLLYLPPAVALPLLVKLTVVGLIVFLACQLSFGDATNAFFAKQKSEQ